MKRLLFISKVKFRNWIYFMTVRYPLLSKYCIIADFSLYACVEVSQDVVQECYRNNVWYCFLITVFSFANSRVIVAFASACTVKWRPQYYFTTSTCICKKESSYICVVVFITGSFTQYNSFFRCLSTYTVYRTIQYM